MAGQRPYTIQIHPKAAKDLAALPRKAQRQVDRRIQGLAADPRPAGSTQLKDPKFNGLRKLRSGNYRIIYDVQDTVLIILIVHVRDRKDAYR